MEIKQAVPQIEQLKQSYSEKKARSDSETLLKLRFRQKLLCWRRNSNSSGLKNIGFPLEKFSRLNIGLKNTGEVAEHNGNPLCSTKVQIVVEEYQKLKEVRKTEKVQADSQKWHCKSWKLFWEHFFNSFVTESYSLRRYLPRGSSCILFSSLYPALETYITIFLLDYIQAEINKKLMQGRGMREIREKSKMISAWLFFKCLVGTCSSFSKAENRNR